SQDKSVDVGFCPGMMARGGNSRTNDGMEGPVFSDCSWRCSCIGFWPGESSTNPFGEGRDLSRLEHAFGRHLELALSVDRLNQGTFVWIARNHGRSVVSACQHIGPRIKSQSMKLLFRSVARNTVLNENRADLLLEEFDVSCGRWLNGEKGILDGEPRQDSDEDTQSIHYRVRDRNSSIAPSLPGVSGGERGGGD